MQQHQLIHFPTRKYKVAYYVTIPFFSICYLSIIIPSQQCGKFSWSNVIPYLFHCKIYQIFLTNISNKFASPFKNYYLYSNLKKHFCYTWKLVYIFARKTKQSNKHLTIDRLQNALLRCLPITQKKTNQGPVNDINGQQHTKHLSSRMKLLQMLKFHIVKGLK